MMIKKYLHTLSLFSRDMRLYLVANMLVSISYVGIYVMLFNLYLLRLGYGPEFIGLINAVAQLGVAAFSLVAGMLGRRWGSRRMLIIGLSVATAGLALVPLAEFIPSHMEAGWLVVTYVLAWLGGATYIVNSLPFVMNVTKSAERAHAFSMREALVPLAVFAGNLLGGLLPGWLAAYVGDTLADPAAYRYALFIAAGIFGLAPLTLLATSKTDADIPQKSQLQTASTATEPSTAGSTAPIGMMLFMGGVILLLIAGKSVTDTFFNVYLDVNLHLSPAWNGAISALAQFLAVPIALLAPLLVSRWGNGWTIMGGTLGMAFSLLLIGFIPHWGIAGLGFMGLNGLFAITAPVFNIISQELVGSEWRATMSGAIAMATGLSRSAMAFGGGYLIMNYSFSTLFFVGAVLTVAGAVLFWGYTWLPRRIILRRAALEIAA
ncbi:MAG: MFS transporter [Anaerolineaceae bacterium]|nr:MFS transporter [Anaerolineaceae bacterium]MCB9099111.1 MFS transporter [Anaerolineales bacterium]